MRQAFSRLKTAARSLRRQVRKHALKRKIEHFESFVDFEPYIQEAVDNIETMTLYSEQEANDKFAELF